MFDFFNSPDLHITCDCGNVMRFFASFPQDFICGNCGKHFNFDRDVNFKFPHKNLNLSFEERVKILQEDINSVSKNSTNS